MGIETLQRKLDKDEAEVIIPLAHVTIAVQSKMAFRAFLALFLAGAMMFTLLAHRAFDVTEWIPEVVAMLLALVFSLAALWGACFFVGPNLQQ
jgi:hypothetical protein